MKKEAAKKETKRLFELKKRSDYFNVATLLFTIGSIFGVYYEQIFMLVTVYVHQGYILWVPRTGLVYGPFSPIYGVGALLIFAVCCIWRDKKWYEYFIYGFFISGVFEYLMALGQEKFFGTRSWDYTDKALNIGGKTTVPYMLVWGALFVIFIYGVLPLVLKLYAKIPKVISKYLFRALAIFLIIDIIISFAAAWRQNQRWQDVPPRNFIEQYLDDTFTDEFLHNIYENAIPIRKS